MQNNKLTTKNDFCNIALYLVLLDLRVGGRDHAIQDTRGENKDCFIKKISLKSQHLSNEGRQTSPLVKTQINTDKWQVKAKKRQV